MEVGFIEGGKVFTLDDLNVHEFFGISNINIDLIKGKYPNLKIVARGSKVRVLGALDDIADFEVKLVRLIAYFKRFKHISEEVVNQVFDTISLSTHVKESTNSSAEVFGDKQTIVMGNNGNIIKAVTVNQQKMVDLYRSNDLLFAVGPAGSGKTYTAIALAVMALKNNDVKKIILTRPAVEAGEKLGFLPGDMKNKLDPYLQPLYDALFDMIPQKRLSQYMEEGTIQIAPLAYMRGRTLDNAFVILDEAQNTTLPQLKMFLTRMGKNAKFIVTGDMSQVDLPRKSDSGLSRCVDMLQGVKGLAVIEMNEQDIIRHPLVKSIVAAFDKQALDSIS